MNPFFAEYAHKQALSVEKKTEPCYTCITMFCILANRMGDKRYEADVDDR